MRVERVLVLDSTFCTGPLRRCSRGCKQLNSAKSQEQIRTGTAVLGLRSAGHLLEVRFDHLHSLASYKG